MLSENDIELLNKSSRGESLLLIAPKGREFEESFQRIALENSEISVLTRDGEELEVVLKIEDIAANIKNGLWEIREACQL